jgi:hypothetical protein
MRRLIAIATLILVAFAVAAFLFYPIYAAARWSPELCAVARGADRLVIKTGGPCHPNPDRDVVRFETTDTNAIAQVLSGLEAKSETGMHCRCCGSPTVYFYRGEQVLAAVSMHHRVTLRWHQSGHSDVTLTANSMSFLLAFFRDHGVLDEDMR